MQRQRDAALDALGRLGKPRLRILEAGCGVGWLANELLPLGEVTALDLSPAAIAEGHRRYPGVRFACGDFTELALDGPFDVVLMADSLSNMSDPQGAIARAAALLAPGGNLLLLTPNRFVWTRRSKLKSRSAGQHMSWPTRAGYRSMLAPWFDIASITTIHPGGDRGILWWVERSRLQAAIGSVVGATRWRNALERAGLGRQFVIVAMRRREAGADGSSAG